MSPVPAYGSDQIGPVDEQDEGQAGGRGYRQKTFLSLFLSRRSIGFAYNDS